MYLKHVLKWNFGISPYRPATYQSNIAFTVVTFAASACATDLSRVFAEAFGLSSEMQGEHKNMCMIEHSSSYVHIVVHTERRGRKAMTFLRLDH